MRRIILCLLFFSVSLPAFGAVRGAHHHHFALEGDVLLWKREKSLTKSLVKAAGAPIPSDPDALPEECRKIPGKTLLTSRELVQDMHYDPALRLQAKLF